MNKLGVAFGVAAVATLAGCKDPDYVSKYNRTPQNEVKAVATEEAKVDEVKPETASETAEAAPLEAPVVESAPVVEPAPEVKPTPAPKPAEPVFTMYTVRRGDYLGKIANKYKVKVADIRSLNPQIKGDKILIGQKIKLPGVIEVEPAPVEKAEGAAKPANKGATEYTGATVEYVVKNGDTLGGIAYGNGINIRQLKKLNGLTSDNLRIGQKLKVPANGKAVAKTKAAPAKTETAAPAPAKTESAPAEAAPAEAVAPAPEAASEAAAEAAVKDEAASPVAAAPAVKTYVVQEGEDMAAISVAWGVTASQIRELNNLGENDQLKPGQTIRLPAEADQQ